MGSKALARGHIESRTDTPPTTPTAMSTSAHQLFTEIRTIHKELRELDDLAPEEKTNGLLTRLVNLCIIPYDPRFTEYFVTIDGVEELCVSLRSLCAVAEGELEKYWAAKILSASKFSDPPQTKDLLHQFPYYQNYVELSRLESSLLSAFLSQTPSSNVSSIGIAFVGSGSLPLTSFCLLDTFPNAAVHNIDRNAHALFQSRKLGNRLGYGERMTFACEDACVEGSGTGWEKFDVVCLAALVGMTNVEKMRVLEGLVGKLREGCLVVCRSARGLRGVLYPVLDLSEELGKMGYEVLAEVHPWTSVVNSVVVLRVI